MKAYFKTSRQVVHAHIDLADLQYATTEHLHLNDDEVTLTEWRQVGYTNDPTTVVFGAPHAIMRLIGAFADDGVDCLLKVEP